MNRATYDHYTSCFNRRDYDGVLRFWAERFDCYLGEERLFGSPEELKAVYGFLHSFVDESIEVQRFVADAQNVFLEGIVRIAAHRTMTQDDIDRAGVKGLLPIEAGEVIAIPQFIHYHLAGGRFIWAKCLISGQPFKEAYAG